MHSFSFKLVTVAEQVGLILTWGETTKTGFLSFDEAHMYICKIMLQ